MRRHPLPFATAFSVVIAGAGTAAANGWLPTFQTQRVEAITVSPADVLALPDLSAYGEVVMTGDVDLRDVADAAAAATATGLAVPQVTSLPRGVSGEPLYQVGGEVGITFTFSTEPDVAAAEAGAEAGATLPAPPPGLHGAQLRLAAGPGVAAIWSSSSGLPRLVVARAVAPSASSSNVPLDVMGDYLLSLPGLPDNVAAQVRAVMDNGSTLPLPVPDGVITTTTEVNGIPATVLTTRDRTLAAVVWVADGVVTVVAGPLDTDEVLDVARSLQ